MKKITLLFISIFIIVNFQYVKANTLDAKNWLNVEIDKIISLYKDESIDSKTRLYAIEETINKSFAGTGIARFVVGNVWKETPEITQKEFVKLFKQHLYLTIGSLMQGYSSQTYKLIDSRHDNNKGVYLIDMEIKHNDQKTLVTWRVKESKDKYYIIDLIVADISLIITKRAEFSSMLKKVDGNLEELNILLIKQNLESYNKLVN